MRSEKLTARNFHHSAAGTGSARCSNHRSQQQSTADGISHGRCFFSGAANSGRGLYNARTRSMQQYTSMIVIKDTDLLLKGSFLSAIPVGPSRGHALDSVLAVALESPGTAAESRWRATPMPARASARGLLTPLSSSGN